MKPAPLDIDVTRGDSFELILQAYSQTYNAVTEEWEDGATQNLTGYTVRSHVRTAVDAAAPTVTMTCSVGGDGLIFCRMTPAQTAGLTELSYVYDVEVTAPDGTVSTWVQGKITVTRDVTR